MGLARKIKRRQFLLARKKFMKDFKESMLNFKKQVKCSECGAQPQEGENIDSWHINKNSENIDLVCTNCYDSEEDQGEENEVQTDTEF
mgnify:CR=1 FL=1|tara:strand:+ start:75 stop:338 length:264 start_codon:yes stop_codon:yes gene_type:complete